MYKFIWNGKYYYAEHNPTIRADKNGNIYGGGGTKTEVVQAPTTPAPSASESAQGIYEAKLKYDPLMAALDWQTQQQYMPQQAQMYADLYSQYYPQYAKSQQALQQELYPMQSKILEAGATNALAGIQQGQDPLIASMRSQAQQRLGSTSGYTPEEQSAINAIRDRETQRYSQQVRERSNLGGTLYGGRSQNLESRGLQELAQGYTAQDIDRLRQQQQLAFSQAGQIPTLESAMTLQRQQAINPYLQIMYPQIGSTQPNTGAYQFQSAVPGADTLYNAMFQASQPESYLQQGQPSPVWNALGLIGGGLASKSSIRYKKNIKLWGKPSIYSNN